MKNKSLIIILVTTVWFFGCKEEDHIISNTTRFTKDSFKETQNLSSIPLQNISDSLFIPNTIYIEGNYLFISERTSDAIMHIVKVPDDEYLGTRGTRGAGPGELLNSWKFFSPETGTIGVFDPELGKAVLYNMDTLLHENRYYSEYLHRDMVYSNGVTIQGNELYFLSNHNKPEARLYSFDLTLKEDSIKKYGELPKLNKPYPNFSPEDERQILSHSKLTNKENLLVMSYYNVPLVEIYDLSKDRQISISGPDELPSPDLFGDLRYYYGSYISDNYIYLLYIEDKTEFTFTSTTVFILDHDGAPVKKLVLDREIFQLAVYEDRFLYGLIHAKDGSEYALVKFLIE
jgi:hypothetical protein